MANLIVALAIGALSAFGAIREHAVNKHEAEVRAAALALDSLARVRQDSVRAK